MAKNKEKRDPWLWSLLFIAVAFLVRFLMLDNKPIHFDESINMWFVGRIIEDGFFTYDPTNFHGPLLFYLMHFARLFTGPHYLYGRLVATIFSFLTLVLLWYGPKEQRAGFRWAAGLLLLSPAMVFFGRSGIHEAVFVFFQVLTFMSFHYLLKKEFKKFWWSFAAGMLGMMALKETFVILLLSLVPAFAVAWWSTRERPLDWRSWKKDLIDSFKNRDVKMPILTMFLFFLCIYGGFGAHLRGILDFVLALMPWLKTGVKGAGHEKEFLHWGKLMFSNEGAILAAFILGLAFVRRNLWLRFYAVFSIVLWLIYSWIPYKTPWCLISILWPFAIVGGMGIHELLQLKISVISPWPKRILAVCLVGFAILEGRIVYQIAFQDPIDMNHPYVYVNSTYAMKSYLNGVAQALKENPALRDGEVAIAMEESWPFPVVFSDFYHLNYNRLSGDLPKDALIYMVDVSEQTPLMLKLKAWGIDNSYQTFVLDVRQGRAPIRVMVRRGGFDGRFPWPLQDLGAM